MKSLVEEIDKVYDEIVVLKADGGTTGFNSQRESQLLFTYVSPHTTVGTS